MSLNFEWLESYTSTENSALIISSRSPLCPELLSKLNGIPGLDDEYVFVLYLLNSEHEQSGL